MTSTNTTDTRCCSASTGRSRSAPRRAKHALIPVTDWTSRPAPRIPRPSDPRVSPAWRRFGRPSTLARSPVTREDSPFRPHRREPEKTPGRSERLPALFSERFGGLPKRPKGADCKSAGKRLRRFESFAPHRRRYQASGIRHQVSGNRPVPCPRGGGCVWLPLAISVSPPGGGSTAKPGGGRRISAAGLPLRPFGPPPPPGEETLPSDKSPSDI